MTPSKRKQTTQRNSRIYTELQLMYERITGKAPDVHSEEYQKLMRIIRLYFTILLAEQEKDKAVT